MEQGIRELEAAAGVLLVNFHVYLFLFQYTNFDYFFSCRHHQTV
jgi:hypothetical protein